MRIGGGLGGLPYLGKSVSEELDKCMPTSRVSTYQCDSFCKWIRTRPVAEVTGLVHI